MGHDLDAAGRVTASSDQLVTIGQLRRRLSGAMRVDEHHIRSQPDRVIVFRGELTEDSEAAFQRITEEFEAYGYTALLREAKDGRHEVVATKGVVDVKPARIWPNLVLFAAVVVSLLYTGALSALGEAGALEALPQLEALILPLTQLQLGIPYAATLMSILLTHELSHYMVGRRYGSPQSLPYFAPLPVLSLFGTVGAVIVQRAPMRSRKAIFDIGVAGPIGGLIVAIPLLIYGLSLSTVEGTPVGVAYWQEGNSLLYIGLKYLVFGRVLPSGGMDVWLHPVAWAAWAGLFLTMLNLVPIGQLDGGHISYALLGARRNAVLGTIALVSMAGLAVGLMLRGNFDGGGIWMMWAFMNLALNRRHPPALDDASPTGARRLAIGLIVALLFILMFMPSPLRQVLPASGVSL